MPKVSVIVPIYNVEKYLKECLDSLLNQTLQDIEIICVNDGSTDSSPQILEEYRLKDKRIKVINKQNSGYGHTMNIGFENATAEYIGVLESDDIAKPEMFNDLYSLITEYDCDFVKSDFYLYYSLNNKIEQINIIKFEDSYKVTNAKENPRLLALMPSIWSGIYKKEFLTKNGIKFLETPGASYQDTSFQHKAFMCAQRVLLTNKAYVYYRQDNVNSSINNKSKVYCITDEYKELHSYLDSHPDLEFFRTYIYELQFHSYHWNLERISNNFMNEFFDYFYNEFKSYYDNKMLPESFLRRINEKFNFDLFINSPQKYLRKIVIKRLRRNIIQFKLTKKEIKIKLFGKELINLKCLKSV